eukprot:TRINITY_DN2543_c0_g1_i12.p1 TRINITY_DN2543_c0_g1~~TRINITY_DN2543_c0_g1_i12.p1  ORF type:complete len:141 (-),score=29.43 TRINITY_DN2543_c0_g1_i12:408-830(-)
MVVFSCHFEDRYEPQIGRKESKTLQKRKRDSVSCEDKDKWENQISLRSCCREVKVKLQTSKGGNSFSRFGANSLYQGSKSKQFIEKYDARVRIAEAIFKNNSKKEVKPEASLENAKLDHEITAQSFIPYIIKQAEKDQVH